MGGFAGADDEDTVRRGHFLGAVLGTVIYDDDLAHGLGGQHGGP